MVGIRSYGAYVPMWRMPLAAIAGSRKGNSSGERAVAYFDEDAVTMGVAAARNCLEGIDRGAVDALLFASTTSPYREKQAASLVAKALDLSRVAATADFAGSLRAGTAALRAALDSVKAGSKCNVLVVAADCRMGAPRSALESKLGDGAAALLVSASEVAAAVEHGESVADEILDVWRAEGEPFVHTWEERFVVEHGYWANLRAVARALADKTGLGASDYARAAFSGPDARSHAGLARSLGFDLRRQVQDPLFGRLGNTGAAFALQLLVAALEEAKPGDPIFVASYGDGADAFALRATERLPELRTRRGMDWSLRRRAELDDYSKYLRFRNLEPAEFDPRGGVGVSATVHFRERDMDISFHAHKCRRCGTEQFPFQRVCYTCFARDAFDRVRLSDREGRVLSYTFDYFAGSPDPPLIVTTVEAEGGARVYLQMTDASPAEVKLDLPVEFTFRKIHEYGGRPNYFWKCTPVR